MVRSEASSFIFPHMKLQGKLGHVTTIIHFINADTLFSANIIFFLPNHLSPKIFEPIDPNLLAYLRHRPILTGESIYSVHLLSHVG